MPELWDIYDENRKKTGEMIERGKTREKFNKIIEEDQMIPTIEINKEIYQKALKIKQRPSYEYIGKYVTAKIDRPLNSKHPKYGFIYEINYGYVPKTISGDGEEIDCYILGVNKPLEKFEGKCIAVIHRINDDDDKLVLVPDGKDFTDEEIKELTYFQEQFFESEIIR